MIKINILSIFNNQHMLFILIFAKNRYLCITKNNIFQVLKSMSESYFSQFSWFREQNVTDACVMVVGCGALGNEVLKNLALFGIGHIWIVDYDIVEPHNLNRSVLFRKEDAEEKRSKAKVAKERLLDINKNLDIHVITDNFTHHVGLGLIMRMNLVISCVDNRWTRYIINRQCMRAGIPWVDGGIDGLEGTARVFMPGENCYACSLNANTKLLLQAHHSCSTSIQRDEESGRVPTTPIVASVIGAIQAQEAIKLLHPDQIISGELTTLCGRMFYFEGQHMSAKTVLFKAYDDECPEHERWHPERKKGLTLDTTISEALKLGKIRLRDHRFVDFIEDRLTFRTFSAMCPDFNIETVLNSLSATRGIPASRLYQHTYSIIDRQFPYQTLSLRKLGFCTDSAIEIESDKGIIQHFLL